MTTPTEARIISPTGRLQASLPGSTLRWSLQSILHQNNEICNLGHDPPLKLSKSFLFHLEWNPDSVPWEKTLQDLAPPPSPASVHPFIHMVLQTNLASAHNLMIGPALWGPQFLHLWKEKVEKVL